MPAGHTWNVDLSGKIRVESLQFKYRYLMLLVDAKSRFMYPLFLRTKDETASAFNVLLISDFNPNNIELSAVTVVLNLWVLS